MKLVSFCLLAVVASVVHGPGPARAGRPAGEVADQAEQRAHKPKQIVDPRASAGPPRSVGASVPARGLWMAGNGRHAGGGAERHHRVRIGSVVAFVIPQLGIGVGAVSARTEGMKARGLRFIGAVVDAAVTNPLNVISKGRNNEQEILHSGLARGGSAFGFGPALSRTAVRAKDRVAKARDGALDNLRRNVFALQP